MKTLLTLLALASTLFGMSAEQIIKKVNDSLMSDNGYSKLTMEMNNNGNKRTMQIESWNKGNDKSFMKILAPKKDYGVTFLKIDNAMWQYVPKIEKTIKIPSSMMMSSFMGSDFTNDDMAKESSLEDDYVTTLTKEDGNKYTITLTPKDDTAVVWGKIVFEVAKENLIPLKAVYFDEDGAEKRVMFYKEVKKIDGRLVPTRWELIPSDKPKNLTVIILEDMNFNAKLDEGMFTQKALIRYSK